MTYRLGVDVGGTFTDVLLHDSERQRVWLAKTPSTPDDQSVGVIEGIQLAAARADIELGQLDAILHGTTVATNAVLERRGALVGLIVTEGFRHILHLAEAWTPGPLFGFMVYEKPEPLTDTRYVHEVPERIGADGAIIEAIDEEAVREALAALVADGEYFQFVELLFGGLPARYKGDGLDGHSWWPLFRTTPAEYAESYYPVRIKAYRPARDTGGAGFYRGGTGIEKEYVFTSSGSFTVNDDRATIHPWGINGGRHGGCSSKQLLRASGEQVELPSKIDQVPVGPGDRLVFRTAGAGGWGDPLDRDPQSVLRDVVRDLVSPEAALREYGVVIDGDTVDETATNAERAGQRAARGPIQPFDFGPLQEVVPA